MEYLEIEGGNPLCGEVGIQGSKNAALPILSAVLLNQGVTVLHNCPKIIDVFYMLEILKGFGCQVTWEKETLMIDSANVYSSQVPEQYARQMRSSIMLLGSLLGRMGTAFVPYPGGCVIGERPIDIHLAALRQMGAELEEEEEGLWAVCTQPKGTHIHLSFPSVGATENVILLAVLAEGETILENAAKEPEIEEVCRFLNSCGAKIYGAGTERIVVTGVEQLHGTEFTIVSDRIVAGTYMLMTAAAGGEVLLKQIPLDHMESICRVLKYMGAELQLEKGGCQEQNLRLCIRERIRAVGRIQTEPYPGFPTDLQSPLLAALTVAAGESRIRENLFEARFKVVEDLNLMGADICIEGQTARVRGVKELHGADVKAQELRGGAALVVASAAAQGVSRIYQYHYIARGYENIIRDLQSLGVVVH